MASVELKSISGKGIKSLALFQKPSLYTVISLTNVNQPSLKINKKKTTVDRSNGQNPVWGQPIRIDIDISHNQDLILQFDLKAEALLGDRVVGRAFVPVADLDLSGAVQHVSYQVKTPEGKANGAINFSYKVDGPGAAVSPPIVTGQTLGMDYSPPAQTFYPAPSAPPVTAYPPQPEAASGYYPTVDPVLAYPPPGTAASGIYPPPPPPLSSAGYYQKLEPGGSYPPLPPHGGYPPQPEYCCREIPQSAPDVGGYYPPPRILHSQSVVVESFRNRHRMLVGTILRRRILHSQSIVVERFRNRHRMLVGTILRRRIFHSQSVVVESFRNRHRHGIIRLLSIRHRGVIILRRRRMWTVTGSKVGTEDCMATIESLDGGGC